MSAIRIVDEHESLHVVMVPGGCYLHAAQGNALVGRADGSPLTLDEAEQYMDLVELQAVERSRTLELR